MTCIPQETDHDTHYINWKPQTTTFTVAEMSGPAKANKNISVHFSTLETTSVNSR
jgi:hypothetical protein